MLIERINQILQIKDIQLEYKKKFGKEPYNLSSWLTSEKFKKEMIEAIKLPTDNSIIEYSYTYSFNKNLLENLINKLIPEKKYSGGISLAANTTQAIVTVTNMLRMLDYKNICILNPAYFSVSKAHDAFSLPCDILTVERVNGEYVIPYEEILKNDYDVIWITSPIFSTSMYFSNQDIDFFEKLMEDGKLIVSDESFCTAGNEIINRINNTDNFIGMYSPHKAIGVNGYKFSAILFPKRFDEIIEHWVDILTGNLPASTEIAINHYLSDNYDYCLEIYRNYMHDSYGKIKKLLESYNNISIDQVDDGSLFTLYFKNLTYEQIKSIDFIRKMIFSTGSSVYPSYLNGFDEKFGFAFRINMALYDNEFEIALKRLLDYLSEYK
ncbi:hypothetical protein SAMN02910327_01735 [Peptostreptococcaceae bacterium pGA-8]|nr:hypothetical protein SAMN02910327_01735 [Peptostreptococcaceae bacterium pGA-8]